MLTIDVNETTNPKQLEKAIADEMDKHIKHFEKELLKVRTGRAHTSMIEDIKVTCYGSVMPLRDLAALSAPDAGLLVIQSWDKTVMPEIEKALSASDLGVTPLNDGTIIRIQLPRMSSARRDDLIKSLGQKLEVCRVSIRNIRKDIHNFIREKEKARKLSEDMSKRFQDLLQKVTDKFIETADKLSQKKEEEVKLL